MTASANPWMTFLESISAGRSVSEMRSLCYVPALLIYYSFDLSGYQVEECINRWLDRFKGDWLRLAIVEALYQGRYKMISIEQILYLWQRRGQPICHFNHEFEQIVCSKLPEDLLPLDYLSVTLEVRPPVYDLPPQDRLISDEDELEESSSIVTDAIAEAEQRGDRNLDASVPESFGSDDSAIAVESESEPIHGDSDPLPLDQPPIDQFSPPLPTSEFYVKLQAFAHDSPPS